MAHALCFDWVLPRAPADSAKKLAKFVGSAGRKGKPCLAACA